MKSINLPREFDPAVVFQSGQTFRWYAIDTLKSDWIGIVSGRVLRIRRHDLELLGSLNMNQDLEHFIPSYFSSADDVEMIERSFPDSQYLVSAVKQFRGLRLITQDPWECLISFVCSINKNIPAISKCIEMLSARFGEKIRSDLDGDFFAFPEPKRLSKATDDELLSCGVGFRSKYIKYISEKIVSSALDLRIPYALSYANARKYLISKLSGLTMGVGPKVCDCALLFSYHKLEAFPIDVWMLRCLSSHYAKELKLNSLMRRNAISSKTYDLTSAKAREYFGNYAGYAQQYLYMKTRADTIRNRGPV
jgi:N-glycosylase/DNA lyase